MQLDLNKDHPYPEFVEKKKADAVQMLIIEAIVQEVEFTDLPLIKVVDLRFDGDKAHGNMETEEDGSIVRRAINLMHVVCDENKNFCIGVCTGGSTHFRDYADKWVRLEQEEVEVVE